MNGHRVTSEVVLLRKTSQLNGVIRVMDYLERPDRFIIVIERPNLKVRDLYNVHFY